MKHLRMVYESGPKKGQEVKIGDTVISFRGEQSVIIDFELPPHSGSNGRVIVKSDMPSGRSAYFPSVFDLVWSEC